MNKKVMAVAVAGVLAAPAAFAQTSNVQLYGRAVLGLDHYEADGARAQGAGGVECNNTTVACVRTGSDLEYKGRIRVFDNSSRVGLRGTEDLGNGLKAIFQIETGVNIDTGSQAGQAGTANASSGFWASRDSFVGLDSNFGRVTFGRQSVWWANGLNGQTAANYINTEIPWANGTNMSGRVAPPVARYNNVLQYTTPTFVGINATVSYAPNAEAVQNNASFDTDGKLWGVTLRGTWGPFYAQYDYAKNQGNDPTGAADAVKITGHKLGASWGYMPGARIGAIWSRNYNENASAAGAVTGLAPGDNIHQDGWAINWEHTFGNFQALAMFGMTSDIKSCSGETISCSNSSATGYTLGGRYFLSKRTWLFASWNMIDNERNSFADYTGGNQTSVAYGLAPGSAAIANGTAVGVPFGADPQIWAVGIFHNF